MGENLIEHDLPKKKGTQEGMILTSDALEEQNLLHAIPEGLRRELLSAYRQVFETLGKDDGNLLN